MHLFVPLTVSPALSGIECRTPSLLVAQTHRDSLGSARAHAHLLSRAPRGIGRLHLLAPVADCARGNALTHGPLLACQRASETLHAGRDCRGRCRCALCRGRSDASSGTVRASLRVTLAPALGTANHCFYDKIISGRGHLLTHFSSHHSFVLLEGKLLFPSKHMFPGPFWGQAARPSGLPPGCSAALRSCSCILSSCPQSLSLRRPDQ